MATTPISTFSGMVSGMDFYALTDQMIAIQRQPAARLESRIAQGQARTMALGEYRTLLDKLKTAAAGFADGDSLQAFSTTVGNGNNAAGQPLLTASAAGGAAPGSYRVVVHGLAAAQKNVGAAQASATDALGIAGTFEIDGQPVTVAETDSLEAVRDRINALNGGASPTGVMASILKVADGDHRLVLTASETGVANGFAAVDTTGTVAATLGLNNIGTAAKDASLEIDGVPITRSTNTVSDAVEGVTLSLKNAEPAQEIEVSVARSTSQAQDAAKAFVDAYNAVVAFVKKQNVAGPEGGANPALFGDATLRSDRAALSGIALAQVAGGAEGMDRLALAGIEITRDGTLELDADAFKTALETRFDDLDGLLRDRGAALEGFIADQTKAITGSIAQKETSIQDSIAAMERRVLDIDSRLEQKREAMIRRWTSFEAAMSRMQSLQQQMSAQYAQLVPKKD